MVKKSLIILLLGIFLVGLTSAFELNGTVYDIDGNPLDGAIVNVTIQSASEFSVVGYNSTSTNASGWFNLTVTPNEDWTYKINVQHDNDSDGIVDFVGQNLPDFPLIVFEEGLSTDYYLRPAGGINITAVNATGSPQTFWYQIKDKKTGYSVADGWDTASTNALVYLDRGRNYSIMIYPDSGGFPVSFDWTNFSAEESYSYSDGSSYNNSTHTLNKIFNVSNQLKRVSGYVEMSGIESWDEIKIVPFLLEPGNMVSINHGMLPYNMSSWDTRCVYETVNLSNAYINETGYQLLPEGKSNYVINDIWAEENGEYNVSVLAGNLSLSSEGLVTNATPTTYSNVSLTYAYNAECSDIYNITTGFYNITLPGTAEDSTLLLYASAKNNSEYYGSFKNISLNYSALDVTEFNFSLRGLFGNERNISLWNAANFSDDKINITTKMKEFFFTNGSNLSQNLTGLRAHGELTLDYSDDDAVKFTYMSEMNPEIGSSFYAIMYDDGDMEDMRIYSQAYEPKRLGERSNSWINSTGNISLRVFTPGEANSSEAMNVSNVNVTIYHSNETCDVINPPVECARVSFAPEPDNFEDFMLPIVIGGGRISTRITFNNISVHFVNVDMLASGPPSSNFDNENDESKDGDFGAAMKFGSNGPTVYDYVFVSMPYTEGNATVEGLNESADVNLSIPYLYNEDWEVIWDTTVNGTNASHLAGNYSHYEEKYDEWDYLMQNTTCVNGADSPNETNPCLMDTANNRIWVRIPHFSGTEPTMTGAVTTIAGSEDSSDDDSSSSSNGGSTTTTTTTGFWTRTQIMADKDFANGKNIELSVKNRIRVKVGSEYHHVGVVEIKNEKVTINISSEPQQATLAEGEEQKFDADLDGTYDILVVVNSLSSTKANLTITSIDEEIVESGESSDGDEASVTATDEESNVAEAVEGTENEKPKSSWMVWLTVIVVLLVAFIGGFVLTGNNKGSNTKSKSKK